MSHWEGRMAHAVEVLGMLAQSAPAMAGEVRGELREQAFWITLDNPASRHALTPAMMAQLAVQVACASREDIAALVLTSSDASAFCAGGQLQAVADNLLHPSAARQMAEGMGALLASLASFPVPVIVRVAGPAVGGGAELLCAGDEVIASRGVWVRFAQASLGVACGWGGAGLLIARLGPKAALRLLSTSDPIAAEPALACGLLDQLVPADALGDAVAQHVAKLAAIPRAALRAVTAQVRASVPTQAHEGVQDAFLDVWGGPAHRAALARFSGGER